MGDTEHEAFDSWLAAYGRAWEARDPRAAADLFSEDATYRETPFDEPARGREAIADYWSRVTSRHKGVRLGYEILAVADATRIAHWWASFRGIGSGKPIELDGIFVIRMGADGLCEEFREWWHYRERDVEGGLTTYVREYILPKAGKSSSAHFARRGFPKRAQKVTPSRGTWASRTDTVKRRERR